MTEKPYADYGRQFASFYDDLFPRGAITETEVDWIAGHAPDGAVRIIELGAGTGRVILPLAERLAAEGRLGSAVAVDISPEMLQQLSDHDEADHVVPVEADVTSWVADDRADLVLCVCGTLSMILDPVEQQAVLANAAAALRPGGRLIVEVHHDVFVRAMHRGQPEISLAIPYPGHRKLLVSFASLRGTDWTLSHRWIDDESMTVVSERSRVTTVEELREWAGRASLEFVEAAGGLSGAPLEAGSPVAVAVFERRADATGRSV